MARRYFEILNTGDLDAFGTVMAADVVFRIFLSADGKIREIWVNMDTLAQAKQLGWVPGP
jgi:ketosteroid isomerase-like protein